MRMMEANVALRFYVRLVDGKDVEKSSQEAHAEQTCNLNLFPHVDLQLPEIDSR